MNVTDRLAKLRRLRDPLWKGAECLLVTNLTNIRYLTGFSGSAGLLFVFGDGEILLTDGRYETQAVEQLGAAGVATTVAVRSGPEQSAWASAQIADRGIASVALEAAHVTWARQQAFATSWFPGVELMPSVGAVEELRQFKDPGEQARLAEAARIADEALALLRPRLGEGMTEARFGRLLDFQMSELGASGPSFETIVASGPNAAKPHHRPSDRVIRRDEAVVIDFGALFDGYHSDMTRTVWVDGVVDDQVRRAVEVVSEAQRAGVEAVRAGVTGVEIDRVCREVIAAAGWADLFVHGTGHGVGLDIHEAPSVSKASTDTLVAGHVVTVEPGVYLPGIGGVRIEDTVVVTDDGCRPLTSTPKDTID